MKNSEITNTLVEVFNPDEVNLIEEGSWQVETDNFRLLVLLSEDSSWLRLLLPIMPFQEAQAFLEQFLQANFDETQEVRYAISQGIIWGVFQHNKESLTEEDFQNAIARLVSLHAVGTNNVFNRLVESRIRQIITAAKLQKQSLETTMQTLDRFYAEGMMGEVSQTSEQREAVLGIWKKQLERLWKEVEI
ncbi:MAG: hypothetical protein ACFB02_16490 [Mastigocoleus sp.]